MQVSTISGSTPPPLVDSQTRLMTKVAHMYHEQGIRQADIAAALHISQARVSRLLKKATEVGIVRTIVVVTPGVHTDLEEELERKYGLLEAVVVDVEGNEEEILRGLGSAGATYLETTLTAADRVGISSWSQTLISIVDRMRPFKNPGATSVIQLVGGVGVSTVQAQATRLLTQLAAILGANPTFVPAPGLVGSRSIRNSLLKDPAMGEVAAQWADLTVALVGIGSLSPSPLLKDSGNAVAQSDQEALLEGGAVGDVCTRFFTADGELLKSDVDSRIVGISPTDFRAIPRRVGLAGGERKRQAIRAAITGKWVNVLVTDVATARELVA